MKYNAIFNSYQNYPSSSGSHHSGTGMPVRARGPIKKVKGWMQITKLCLTSPHSIPFRPVSWQYMHFVFDF